MSSEFSELKASLQFSIGEVAKEQYAAASRGGGDDILPLSGAAVATLSEIVLKYTEAAAADLRHFAKHANRKVVSTADVKLLARKVPRLQQDLDSFDSSHLQRRTGAGGGGAAAMKKKKKRKQHFAGASSLAAASKEDMSQLLNDLDDEYDDDDEDDNFDEVQGKDDDNDDFDDDVENEFDYGGDDSDVQEYAALDTKTQGKGKRLSKKTKKSKRPKRDNDFDDGDFDSGSMLSDDAFD